MFIVLCVLTFILKITSSQFPPHMDLQKAGEVKFKNEKYNVLKVSRHIMKDYFRDVMLQKNTTEFPTRKVYLDHNGFRHYWSGLEQHIQSLRRSKVGKEAKATEVVVDENTEAVATEVKTDVETTTLRKWIYRKGKRVPIHRSTTQNVQQYLAAVEEAKLKSKLRADKKTTLVKTTYFCPYIGVITTHNYFEDE